MQVKNVIRIGQLSPNNQNIAQKIIPSQNLTNSKKRQSLKNPQKTGSHSEVFCKQVFLEIPQNSQENTCARVSFLIKLQPERPAVLSKKRLAQMFPVNFAKFLRTTFLAKHFWWLLLKKVPLTMTFTNGDFHRISQSQLKKCMNSR